MVLVNQQRRALIAQACAGGKAHTGQGAGLVCAWPDVQALAEVPCQRPIAQHAISDVVAPQQVEGRYGFQVEEAVKAGDTFHNGGRQTDAAGNLRQDGARQPMGLFLHFAQDLHQGVSMPAMAVQHRVNYRCTVVTQPVLRRPAAIPLMEM